MKIAASKFKGQCLKILDRVAQTRVPVVVTKRGRPVATVVPYSPAKTQSESLVGSILEEHEDPFGTDEEWGS